jgi:hypothetical protein
VNAVLDADLDADHWCTTEDVQDEFELEVGNQELDHAKRIQQATRSMKARWAEATGKPVSEAPATSSDIPDLLQDATAYLAASKQHLAFAQNVSGTNDGDQRHVFLEDAADDAFADWKRQADLDPGSESDGEASEVIGGQSGVIGGDANNPVHRD